MRKAWTWTTTGYTLAGKSHDEIVETCRFAGLAGIEGSPPLFEGKTETELQVLGASYRDAGLCIETFHLPFSADDDIASFYETTRRRAVDNMRFWMGKASLLGATVGIQHPTTNRTDAGVEGLETYFRQIGKSLDTLLREAEALDFTIALENMLPSGGGRFTSRPEHFERIIRDFAHPNLGFCLDTGHALVAGRGMRTDSLKSWHPASSPFIWRTTRATAIPTSPPATAEWIGVYFSGMPLASATNVPCASKPRPSTSVPTIPTAHGPGWWPIRTRWPNPR